MPKNAANSQDKEMFSDKIVRPIDNLGGEMWSGEVRSVGGWGVTGHVNMVD